MGGGGTGVGAGASKKSATPPGEGGGGGKQEFTIDTQLSLIKSQDAQLSELSSIIQRQRNLGEAIGKELGNTFLFQVRRSNFFKKKQMIKMI